MNFRPRELCSHCRNGSQEARRTIRYNCSISGVSSPVDPPPSHCFYYDGPHLPVDVVIITAVQVEYEAVLHQLHPDGERAWGESRQTIANGRWRTCFYRSGRDSRAGVRLALAMTRQMGLPAAASLTALAIQLFRPSHVVMLGITAGRKGETAIGDIVVPVQIWDYGAGKWEEDSETAQLLFKPRGEAQPIEESVRQCCHDLSTRSHALRAIRDDWSSGQDGHRSYAAPVIRLGPMVSGAAVVNADAVWARVLAQNDKILALDMEAYAVALATYCAKVPKYQPFWLVAKSVCDYGLQKDNEAQPYAAFTSVRFFRLFLEEFILGQDYRNYPVRDNLLADG